MSETENPRKVLFAITEETSDALLTPWSLVHFLSGAACKGLGWGFWTNFAFHGAYEVKDHLNLENIYNSKFNSVGDQVCSVAGYVYADVDIKWLWYWGFSYVVAYALGEDIG